MWLGEGHNKCRLDRLHPAGFQCNIFGLNSQWRDGMKQLILGKGPGHLKSSVGLTFLLVFVSCAIFSLPVGLSLAAQQAGKETKGEFETFGAPSRLKGKPLTVAEALKPQSLDRPVRVEGKVEQVCQNKGCWMVLTDGKQSVRVTFKDYGFFVPTGIAGKTVIAEGVVSKKTISEDEARHQAEEAGKSEEEIKKIVGDQKQITLVADTVLVPTR
jgi:hypothetical protein